MIVGFFGDTLYLIYSIFPAKQDCVEKVNIVLITKHPACYQWGILHGWGLRMS